MIVKTIALCLMFGIRIIEAPEPDATENPEVVGAAIPWDGVTMTVEDMLRNPRAKEEMCETLRENFNLSSDIRPKVMRDLNSLTRKDWAEIDNKYKYITVSLKPMAFGYSYSVGIHFHNEQINGKSIEQQIDE